MIRFHITSFGEFGPRHKLGPCVWPHFDLLIIHHGRVWVELLLEQRVEIGEGEAILIYPHTPFVGESITPSSRASVQHFALESGPAMLDEPFASMAGLRRGFQMARTAGGPALELDVRRAMLLAMRPQTPLVRQMRIATLTLILAQLWPEDGSAEHAPGRAESGSDEMDQLMAWAEAHLSDGLKVDDLARRAGWSASHFRAVFARRMGLSAGRFLHGLRMRQATRLLRETQMPIKQLARQSGYADAATFHHAFTAHAGATPGDYRRMHAPAG